MVTLHFSRAIFPRATSALRRLQAAPGQFSAGALLAFPQIPCYRIRVISEPKTLVLNEVNQQRPARRLRLVSFWIAVFSAGLLPSPLHAQLGGGFTAPGMRGEYFANPHLSGSPSFTRAEVRLDFDWGTVLPVGGSISPELRDFPTDGFSVRYTGSLIPAFSETYIFALEADDGARLLLRPSGAGDWTTLLDHWSQPGRHTASAALERGQTYDLRVEYQEVAGSALLRLSWSSPSVPEEVIDPVAQLGFNHDASWPQTFADIAKCARAQFDPYENGAVPSDASGWPLNDAQYYFQESINQGLDLDPLMLGRLGFSFTGRFDPPPRQGLFGNVDRDSLAFTYDPLTNTTRGSFLTLQGPGSNASSFRLALSDRGGLTPPRRNGITQFRLMRPLSPGADASYPEDALFTTEIKRALERFTLIRADVNNANQETQWEDRTLPSYFNQTHGKSTPTVYPPQQAPVPNGPSWEHKIMLSNETGRDLYLNLPLLATGVSPGDSSSYLHKLARLIKYGSDGVEPYSEPTAQPVYPPLNPNLRLYLEVSNELWNFSSGAFRQSSDLSRLVQADAEACLEGNTSDPLARPEDFPILNHDNLSTARDSSGLYLSLPAWRVRKLALLLVRTSEVFRAVFGDAAMHTRIRPVYEWQYGNANGTASAALGFLDDYFHHASGTPPVAQPRPVNYFIWGGGGASYYGAQNPDGVTDGVEDPSFESPAVPPGYTAAPAGSAWSFTGSAGLARDAGEGDGIPPPPPDSGGQVAYIDGNGALETSVTIPATQISSHYAFVFRAVQRVQPGAALDGNGEPIPDQQELRVSVNGQPCNARSFNQRDGYQPLPWNADYPWEALVVYWARGTVYYPTLTFSASPGSQVVLRIEGAASPGNVAFIDEVHLTSVDQILAQGLPGGGDDPGAAPGTRYRQDLETQANWAAAFGLRYITYEGGWSAGGDTGGSPLQNQAKFFDARAATANARALDIFHRAGGLINTLGTYPQWPSWSHPSATEGLLSLDSTALVQGQLQILHQLPSLPENGATLPARLDSGAATLTSSLQAGSAFGAGSWATWNVIAPVSAAFQVSIQTAGDGSWTLARAGGSTIASGTGSGAGSVFLTRGLHALKLRGVSGTFTLLHLSVESAGSPPVPRFTGASAGDGTLTIDWTPVPGATAYELRWGSAPGEHPERAVLTGTSHSLSGLAHDTTRYFVVRALAGDLPSLPSEELGATAHTSSQSGSLAAWDLLGAGSLPGDAGEVAATSTFPAVDASPIRRGRSLYPSPLLSSAGGKLNAHANVVIDTLSAARGLDYFFEWAIAPLRGAALDLASLQLAAYQTGSSGSPAISVEASLDAFRTSRLLLGTAPLSAPAGTASQATLDLSSWPALQGVPGPVTFRAYFHGVAPHSEFGLGLVPPGTPSLRLTGRATPSALPLSPPPQWLLPSGTYATARTARLLAPAPDATLRGSRDGSAPTPSSGFPVDAPLPLGAGSTTLRAIAQRPGCAPSAPVTEIYHLDATGEETVLLECDFRGSDPGLHLPWTATLNLAPGYAFSGWTRGPGNELFTHEGNDALVFSQIMDGEDGGLLSSAIAQGKYLSCVLSPPSPVDLRGARIRFTLLRFSDHAPSRTSVFTSLEGFTPGAEVFSTYRFPVINEPRTHEFTLPFTPPYAAVAGPVEFRLYSFHGAFAFHRSALLSFRLAQRAQPPPPAIISTALPPSRVGAPYLSLLPASGLGPFTWELVSGALPPGLLLDASGQLSGIPRAATPGQARLRLTDADGFSQEGDFTFTTESPLALWLTSHGLSPDTPATADPWNQGLPIQLRHAFGNAPLPALTALPAGAGITYRFHRSASATDLRFRVSGSTDLQTWTTLYEVSPEGAFADPALSASCTPFPGGETYDLTLPATDQRRFLRLETSPWP